MADTDDKDAAEDKSIQQKQATSKDKAPGESVKQYADRQAENFRIKSLPGS